MTSPNATWRKISLAAKNYLKDKKLNWNELFLPTLFDQKWLEILRCWPKEIMSEVSRRKKIKWLHQNYLSADTGVRSLITCACVEPKSKRVQLSDIAMKTGRPKCKKFRVHSEFDSPFKIRNIKTLLFNEANWRKAENPDLFVPIFYIKNLYPRIEVSNQPRFFELVANWVNKHINPSQKTFSFVVPIKKEKSQEENEVTHKSLIFSFDPTQDCQNLKIQKRYTHVWFHSLSWPF